MGPAPIIFAVAAGGTFAIAASSDRDDSGPGDDSARIQQIQQDNERNQRDMEAQLKEKEKQINEEKQKSEEKIRELQRKTEEEKEKMKLEKELAEKKRKEEEEKKEKEKQKKIKDANDFYKNEKDNYEKQKLNEIKNGFNSNKNTFCLNHVDKLHPFINEQIPNIFKNFENKIKEKINQNYTDNLNEIKSKNNNKKKRILLIGKTGVGKSTLINAIFDFDLAETGFGRPITMHDKPKKYESNKYNDLELFDSRGIEIDPNYGVEINYNRIKKFINEQFQKNEPLDSIWYCITGNKIEDVELDLIKNLRSLYKDNSLSTIIVYTQAFFETDFIDMKNYLINKIDDKLIIHNVVAKMKKMGNKILKKFGLDELLKKTSDLIESNINSVLISTAKTKTQKEIQDLIEEKIKFTVNPEIHFNSIIENSISSFLGNDCITQDVKNIIVEFYSQYKIRCNSIIEENLNPIIEREALNMTNDLKNIVSNVLNKFDNIITIDQKGYLEEYKKRISEALLETANEFGSNNINLEMKKFMEKVIKDYIKNINKNYISSI